MLMCVICGEWYPAKGRDVLDICEGCWPNFSGAQPPLDPYAEVTHPALTLTPRQVEALRQLHGRWQARREDDEQTWC